MMGAGQTQPQLVATSGQLGELGRGDKVKVRSPRAGERGVWVVEGQVRNSGPDDPAYDVHHQLSGRRRIFRRSRLEPVVLGTPAAPKRPQGQPTPTLFPQDPQEDTAQV
jgi:hypothetical protein